MDADKTSSNDIIRSPDIESVAAETTNHESVDFAGIPIDHDTVARFRHLLAADYNFRACWIGVAVQVGLAEALKQAQLYLKDLTRREALDVLVRFLADDILDPAKCASESRSEMLAGQVALGQADAYLKGMTAKGGRDSTGALLGEKDEAKIFADPYHWAPFVLVGDHALGALRG